MTRILTRTGLAVAGTGSCLTIIGIALGYREIMALGAVLVISVMGAAAAVLGRLNAEVHRAVAPERVSRGELALGEITLTSPNGRGMRATTAVDLIAGQPIPVPLPRLEAGGRVSKSYRLPTDRRGAVSLGPLKIERADPLGLASRDRALGEVATLLVRPRIIHLTGLPGGRSKSLDGPTSDSAPHGTVTYHALRDYTPGDDRRHIHWKASARTGKLIVRQYVDTSQPDTWVLLACSPGPDEQAFEEAVEFAASVCVSTTELGFPVSLILPHERGGETLAGSDLGVLLDRLAVIAPDDADTRLQSMIEGHTRRGHGDSAVIVVARPLTAVELDATLRLRRRCPSVVVCTVGGSSGNLPNDIIGITGSTADDLAAAWQRRFGTGGAVPFTGLAA